MLASYLQPKKQNQSQAVLKKGKAHRRIIHIHWAHLPAVVVVAAAAERGRWSH